MFDFYSAWYNLEEVGYITLKGGPLKYTKIAADK